MDQRWSSATQGNAAHRWGSYNGLRFEVWNPPTESASHSSWNTPNGKRVRAVLFQCPVK